ncbi:MAG: imidazoleglycerol-phosphate dehydratase HisB [Syntrophales bacterium]|nr:imidazoleglycerol-phosphate dehydratase HisB [Syntrophales bacterium]
MRIAKISRKTKETTVSVEVNLDGSGKVEIDTPIPFLNHMLTLFAFHGLFDLKVNGEGDTMVDDHHLVEDIGICLGSAFKEALGKKENIERYGFSVVPMDETLCSVAVDVSGRPCLVYRVKLGKERVGSFDPGLVREFLKAFSDHCAITMHVNLAYGRNNHHMLEAVFKAFARAMREAVARQRRIKGVMSTKGSL